jgi:hypothetical protein
MEFEAYALNPSAYEVYANGSLFDSGSWVGGNVTIDADGLEAGYNIIEFRAIHISGNFESAFSSATVTDLTPPTWIVRPHDELLRLNQALSQQLEAHDESGIGDWYVNDTLNFAISETGLLTNNTVLAMGDYGLRVYVEDVFGNVQDWEIRIRVYPSTTTATTPSTSTTLSTETTSTTETQTTTSIPSSSSPTTTPTSGDITTTIIIIVVGGVVVIIIIVIRFRKR